MTNCEMTLARGAEPKQPLRMRAISSRSKVYRRSAEAGVTLVEVLIVVAIMALIASGVAFSILPKYKEAQKSTAEHSARVLRQAIQDWQRLQNESTCPSMSQLVEGKELDSASKQDDPWGMPWILSCTEDEVYVQSSGPDKKPGTADDISVPKLQANNGG